MSPYHGITRRTKDWLLFNLFLLTSYLWWSPFRSVAVWRGVAQGLGHLAALRVNFTNQFLRKQFWKARPFSLIYNGQAYWYCHALKIWVDRKSWHLFAQVVLVLSHMMTMQNFLQMFWSEKNLQKWNVDKLYETDAKIIISSDENDLHFRMI